MLSHKLLYFVKLKFRLLDNKILQGLNEVIAFQ